MIQAEPRRHRILLVTSLLRQGGAERVAASLASGFSSRGCDVAVFVMRDLDGSEYPVNPDVEVRPLGLIGESNPWWRLKGIRSLAGLRRAVIGFAPDLVVAFQDKLNAATLLALAATGIPVVCTEHVVPFDAPLGWVWETLRRLTYRSAAAVVVPTQAIARAFRDSGIQSEVLAYPPVLPSGSECTPLSSRPKRFRAAGRLAPVKGFDRLVSAFGVLSRSLPDWTLEIAGDGPERSALVAQIDSLKLTDRVLLAGRIADVPRFFADARVAVISSRSEAFPLVLLEAWASGAPVVALRSSESLAEVGGDAVEWADAGDGPRLASDLVEQLARSMRHLAVDHDHAESLVRRGFGRLASYRPEPVLDAWSARLPVWEKSLS